jgi:hypothetical protein
MNLKVGKNKKNYIDPFLALFFLITSFLFGCLFYRSGTIPKIKHYIGDILLKIEKPKSFIAKPKYSLSIDLKFKDLNKLILKRSKAYELGQLINDSDSFVPAKIGFNNNLLDAKIRLKGDNLDHLHGDKWSFRVKLKGEGKILGMNVFSLQHPKTREYLKEYLIHKLAKSQGLISLRYEFVNLVINGEDKGIYALEEHFTKYLIENNHRRDGPLLKFDESATWQNEHEFRGISMKYWNEHGSFLSSEVNSFVNLDDLKSSEPEKHSLYIFGISLLDKFKSENINASEVFDVEQWAKLFALCDLTGSQHGFRWHNIRFYFNPISRKFEPVLYDANGGNNPYEIIPVILKSNQNSYNKTFIKKIFSDIKIYDKYLNYIYHFIEEDLINSFFKKNINEINLLKVLLHKEFPRSSLEYKKIYSNQFEYACNYFFPDKPLSAHYFGEDSDDFSIGNLQSIPINLLNLEGDKNNTIMDFQNARIVGKLQNKSPFFYNFSNDNLSSNYKINFNFVGSEEVFSTKLKLRTHPSKLQLMDNFKMISKLKENNFIILDETNKIIKVKEGIWQCSDSLLVPPNYKLVINENTVIDLVNEAKIVSFSPVIIAGSNNRCVIKSSDFTSQGITILNTKRKSLFEKVDFLNLANLKEENWFLSGSVNVYNTTVVFNDCTFTNLHGGDDSLNIIKSNFKIESCTFQDSYSDALDIDFGMGLVTNSVFINSANDAIDISGAEVNASNIFIHTVGDKAVSVGERASVSISKSSINFAEIGLTCKDGSILNVDNADLKNTKIGLCAFIKKPEYGPAVVTANNIKGIENTEIPFLIEEGSKITYDSIHISPTHDNVRSILYGNEYGKSSK